MPNDFIVYLFNDLRSHMEKLKDEAYTEDPDGERVEYHYQKAASIIGIIQEKGFAEVPAVRLIGSKAMG